MIIENEIKERLKNLFDIKATYIIKFDYGRIEVFELPYEINRLSEAELIEKIDKIGLVEKEIDNLKKKLNAVAQDFYEYVQGGEEICVFCLHNDECEPGETLCGATYKGFKSRWLNEREDL